MHNAAHNDNDSGGDEERDAEDIVQDVTICTPPISKTILYPFSPERERERERAFNRETYSYFPHGIKLRNFDSAAHAQTSAPVSTIYVARTEASFGHIFGEFGEYSGRFAAGKNIQQTDNTKVEKTI